MRQHNDPDILLLQGLNDPGHFLVFKGIHIFRINHSSSDKMTTTT